MDTTPQPLRVGMMLESRGPGGAEMMLLQLARALRRRGHAVHPFHPEPLRGWLVERLRADGFEPLPFRLRRAVDLRCVRELAGRMRALGLDLMHGHEFDGALYGVEAARRSGRPSLVTLHGNLERLLATWQRRLALRFACRRAGAVVAVSQATRAQLVGGLGLPAGQVSVIRNGADVGKGDAQPVRRELGIRPGERLILAVGSLIPLKGHAVLLEALARLDAAGFEVPWRLVIAGGSGGSERERLEAFARDHGLADRVHVLLARDDVADLHAASDLFVMPSLWEGLPLAVLEAMLAGTPVVATEVSGIPEAVVSGESGLLVPPGDADALAAAMRRMLEDEALRERLAAAARERGRREFTVEAMTDAYERLYGGLCGAGGR